ncbi:MAG: CbiX/SirB N-terminal domain-containing protein [Myxococcales bacterium]|nr:CbiX/SirB N-terminal domain-containing protein [Myxococcales bacterium]
MRRPERFADRLSSPLAFGLIVLAHGSRSTKANDEVRVLAQGLGHFIGASAAADAFLEQAEPSLEGAVGALASAGITDIRVFPYFLNSGRHVLADVPKLISDAAARFPDVQLTTLPHLGGLPGFVEMVAELLVHASVTTGDEP